MTEQQPFMQAFRGSFRSALRWHELDALWTTLRANAAGWYIYAIGEPPPSAPADQERFHHFIDEIDALLRREHEEEYCGIVYADDHDAPAFVKIYDPNNLGVSCGFSDNPPLPGWVLSRMRPIDIPSALAPPGGRRRWWKKIFGG